MKRKCLNVGLMVLGLVLATSSCKKKEEEKPATVVATPTPVTGQGFIWSENGSTTTQKADSAAFSNQYSTLYAINKNGTLRGTVFEINLTANTAGTYTLGNGNALAYIDNSYLSPSSGNVVISANANGKISGSFSATYSSGSITSVNGTFTNIDLK